LAHTRLGPLVKPEDFLTERRLFLNERKIDDGDGIEGTPNNPEVLKHTPITEDNNFNADIIPWEKRMHHL